MDCTRPFAPASVLVALALFAFPGIELAANLQQTGCVLHVVRKGESLLQISAAYGASVDSIMTANGLLTDQVFVGQRLTVCPPGPPAFSSPLVTQGHRSQLQGVVGPGASVTTVNAREVNVRRTPGYLYKSAADVLTRAMRGQVLHVVGGPRYVDGLPWWEVSLGAERGWIAECTASGYRLLAPTREVYGTDASAPGLPWQYVVSYGDTLTELSNRYRVSAASIIRFNGLTGTSLQAGQWLLLPPPELTPPVDSIVGTLSYVGPGNMNALTLVLDPAEHGPCTVYTTDRTSIALGTGQAASRWQLQAGQIIEVIGTPGTLGVVEAREVYILVQLPHDVWALPLPSVSRGLYTVWDGETLQSIASKLGTTVTTIQQANGMAPNETGLRIGQVLRIPEIKRESNRFTAAAAGWQCHETATRLQPR